MNLDDILKRYYAGETSLEEEHMLKNLYRKGELPNDPILAYRPKEVELPEGLVDRLSSGIRQHNKKRSQRIYLAISSAAACMLLIIGVNRLLPQPLSGPIYLSDRTKMERFEEAMRVIGNVLEEKAVTEEKILYEDQNFVIITK